ncbi:MAG: RAD55 family ATPase [Longimicrobiales bacterium]
MMRSGIAPLDAQLGGVADGRIHLLTGGVGTGKTSACLHFLAAGLETGETAAILTLDRPAELSFHAAYLGIDIATPVHDGRLIALRFGPQFSRRFAYLPSLERVTDELRRMIGGRTAPARVVIDPISPFLADGSHSGTGIAAIVRLLEDIGATTLLTYPGPLAGGEDRRLDPVLESAATVVWLSRDAEGGHAMSVLRARLAAVPRLPLRFVIAPALGIVEVPRLEPLEEHVLRGSASEDSPIPRVREVSAS